ncbi:MAG: hypothetical protein Q9164_005121 [Protoblastenia rupestris]
MARPSVEHEDLAVVDDRPVAVRRKRRCSTALVDPLHEPKIEPADDSKTNPPEPARTPSKPKKKVRFSDPGPALSTSASSSTGLTPALCRTSFDSFTSFESVPTPRLFARPSRRKSLPNLRETTLPLPSLPPPPGALSGKLQFQPFCDVLDNRAKRRLRRNNLSEELNEIDAEKKKTNTQGSRVIQDLKDELALVRKQQMHGEVDGQSNALRASSRVQELEKEIIQLKEEMCDHTAEPQKHARTSNEPTTPDSIIFVDDTAEDFVEADFNTNSVLREQTPKSESLTYNNASTQDALSHPREVEILRSARLSLEYLFPGEIALGLVPDDPKQLLDTMLERLQSLRTRTLIAEDSLSTTQTQESNLRTQFNAVLGQLERARKYAEKVGTKRTAETARADAAEAKVDALGISVGDASSKVRELEASTNEKDRSIQRLQDALESYRIEVGKLELLVTRIEGDQNAEMTKLKSDMDEAVADLECHVAAETIGRRAAEAEVELRDQKIKELKTHEKELKTREKELMNAVNEKQQIIRDTEKAFTKTVDEKQQIIRNTERAFTQQSTSREHEVGTLNVRISQLSSELHTSHHGRERAEQACDILMRKLEEEKEASMRAIAAVQEELKQCSTNAEGIRAAHESDSRKRGRDVMEHKGLLTPTIGGRFRDADEIEGIDGFIEVHRGKKGKGRRRPDSGIVILEEDEDEDMVMNDY